MGAVSILAVVVVLVLLASVFSFSDSERFGWIGRVVGVLLAGGLCAFIAIGFFAATSRPQSNKRTRCMSNLAQIGKAAAIYAMDNNEQLPASFAGLTNYVDNPKLFCCPEGHTEAGDLANIDSWTDYILVTNVNMTNSATVLVYCNPSNHNGFGINVLFVDCSVRWVNTADFPSLGVDVTNLSRAATGPATGM